MSTASDRLDRKNLLETGAAIGTAVQSASAYDAGAVIGDIELNSDNGLFQKISLTGTTQARVFLPPTGGSEGRQLTVRIANADDSDPGPRTLEFDPQVIKPSLSTSTWPRTLVNDKAYRIKLEYTDSRWELLAFVGGY